MFKIYVNLFNISNTKQSNSVICEKLYLSILVITKMLLKVSRCGYECTTVPITLDRRVYLIQDQDNSDH